MKNIINQNRKESSRKPGIILFTILITISLSYGGIYFMNGKVALESTDVYIPITPLEKSSVNLSIKLTENRQIEIKIENHGSNRVSNKILNLYIENLFGKIGILILPQIEPYETRTVKLNLEIEESNAKQIMLSDNENNKVIRIAEVQGSDIRHFHKTTNYRYSFVLDINLRVSLSESDLSRLIESLLKFREYLRIATVYQFEISSITIFFNRNLPSDIDIISKDEMKKRCGEVSDIACAYLRAITWKKDFAGIFISENTIKRFTTNMIARTVLHEFGHYAFGLLDLYGNGCVSESVMDNPYRYLQFLPYERLCDEDKNLTESEWQKIKKYYPEITIPENYISLDHRSLNEAILPIMNSNTVVGAWCKVHGAYHKNSTKICRIYS